MYFRAIMLEITPLFLLKKLRKNKIQKLVTNYIENES